MIFRCFTQQKERRLRNNDLPKESVNNGVYLHWDSFAPESMKCSILALISAYKICSTYELLHEGLGHIEREPTELKRIPKMNNWSIEKKNGN